MFRFKSYARYLVINKEIIWKSNKNGLLLQNFYIFLYNFWGKYL